MQQNQKMMKSAPDEVSGLFRFARRSGFLRFLFGIVQSIGAMFVSLPYEYESPQRVFGVPLLAINLGFDNPDGKMRKACGVIAIANHAKGGIAIGVFLASGVFSLGLVSVGFVAVSIAGLGVVAVSVFGAGVVSVSVFAVGYIAVGILAVGYQAVGIAAIGVEVTGIVGFGRKVRALFPF